jgi:hypothetical protein
MEAREEADLAFAGVLVRYARIEILCSTNGVVGRIKVEFDDISNVGLDDIGLEDVGPLADADSPSRCCGRTGCGAT